MKDFEKIINIGAIRQFTGSIAVFIKLKISKVKAGL
jgi:hypothetical protein